MIGSFFHTLLYVPIYNLLIAVVGVLPGGDLGLAVIVVTLIIKAVITPLSFSALRTQRAMKVIEPELNAARETYKDDKEKQAKEMFAIYKKYDIKPFASILTLFIQLPVLIALYWVFRIKTLTQVETTLLYPFVAVPAAVSPLFLGLIAIGASSIILAIIAGVTQFAQAYYAIPVPEKATGTPSTQEEFARVMALQARYVFPLLIGAVAYTSGAIALYFITSNLVGVVQEFFVRRMPLIKEASPLVSEKI